MGIINNQLLLEKRFLYQNSLIMKIYKKKKIMIIIALKK